VAQWCSCIRTAAIVTSRDKMFDPPDEDFSEVSQGDGLMRAKYQRSRESSSKMNQALPPNPARIEETVITVTEDQINTEETINIQRVVLDEQHANIKATYPRKALVNPRNPDFYKYVEAAKHTHNDLHIVHIPRSTSCAMKHNMGKTLSATVVSHMFDHRTNSDWLDNICVCHFRAAKVSGAMPEDQCMPTSHVNSFFEPITAAKAAELNNSNERNPEMQAIDVEDLMVCAIEAAAGQHELCSCSWEHKDTECPMVWVASFVDGQCTWTPLRELAAKLADKVADLRARRAAESQGDAEYEAWHDHALAEAERLRQIHSVRTIENWWLWLWEDSMENAISTAMYLDNENGAEHIAAYLGDDVDLGDERTASPEFGLDPTAEEERAEFLRNFGAF